MNLTKSALRLLLGTRLPRTTGTMILPGLTSPVTIHRDEYHIPYIEAKSESDLWFGLGFCQGQDRAFQLEMLLRVTRGTLAGLVGESMLPMDRLSRRIGFHRAAEGHARLLPQVHLDIFEHFAQGLTAGAALGGPQLAHEFAILRSRPTPWTVVDILAGMNYIGLLLSAWTGKLSRWIVYQQDGAAALAGWDSEIPAWLPVTQPVGSPAGPALHRLAQDLDMLAGLLGLSGGSNNWVLASTRTADGLPLLANDPHLSPVLPNPWYLAHLRSPDLEVAGATFVGSPMVAAGHNGAAAWGVTAGLVDNIDLYLEELNSAGDSAREGDQFVPLQVLKETYPVKGKPAREEVTHLTGRGPIISDVIPAAESERGLALSFRATWHTPRSTAGALLLQRATDFAAFRQGVGLAPLVSLNLVYADQQRNIGWQFAGEAPDRRNGWGTLPMPGWDPDYQWKNTFIPFDSLPNLHNPPTGYIATANNKPAQDGDAPYLGRDFVEGYRQKRITELLSARSDWRLADMLTIQLDQVVIPWREMREIILRWKVDGEEALTALRLLSAWDGVAAPDSHGAAVYETWIVEMLTRLAKARAPRSYEWALGKSYHPFVNRPFIGHNEVAHLVELLHQQPPGLFREGWKAEVNAALAETIRRLRARFGPEMKYLSWGALHPLVLRHTLGSKAPLDQVFNRGPYPMGGDAQTVFQLGRLAREFWSEVTSMPNLRMSLEVGNWDHNAFQLAGGQSGNPFSPHYDDLLARWLRAEAITIPWSRGAVQARKISTLLLLPKQNKEV